MSSARTQLKGASVRIDPRSMPTLPTRVSTTEGRENFQLEGWRVGAGVQKDIGSNTYAKLEYRYSNYHDADFQFANGTTTNQFEVDTDRHQVVAGVGFRF